MNEEKKQSIKDTPFYGQYKDYREGAIAELKRQLANARTDNRRRKILNRLKSWGVELAEYVKG